MFEFLTHRKALKTILVTDSLILLASAMLGPIYTLYVEELGGSLADAIISITVFALAGGITMKLQRKFNNNESNDKIVVTLGYILIGLGFIIYMLIRNIWAFFVLQAWLGICEAIYTPHFYHIHQKHMGWLNKDVKWEDWRALNYFTTAIGAAIGGIVISFFGFNIIFLIMAILSISSAAYIHLLPKRTL